LRMGTMGFGKSQVSGLSRVPSPPAISTALIRPSVVAQLQINER
jgi:hypothetical protein